MPKSGRPILVVEDDPDSRMMLKMFLEFGGAKVIEAASGHEAFELALRYQPRLILLDLMMPLMTGEEFRRAQMADDSIRNIPVVVVSAHPDALRIAERMGAFGVISKPIEFERLNRLVFAPEAW